MKNVLACLAAAFLTILVTGAPATANDSCNADALACRVEANTPFRLAAEMPAQPRISRAEPRISRAATSSCTGKTGVALQRCKCEARGEPGFPCRFVPAHPPVPASCLCR